MYIYVYIYIHVQLYAYKYVLPSICVIAECFQEICEAMDATHSASCQEKAIENLCLVRKSFFALRTPVVP
jgi:hypothetical protein